MNNIISKLNDDDLLVIKKAQEQLIRAESGILSVFGFLNKREQYIICRRFEKYFQDDEGEPLLFFYGGYKDAERALFVCMPSYMRYSDNLEETIKAELSEYITPLFIKKSGYVNLSHRDYLGAIIGLGIERFAIGDILLCDEGAIVFVTSSVSELMKNELIYIGRDKVKVTNYSLPNNFNYERKFENIKGTVSSPRLDAVLSEIAHISRDGAKSLIKSGLCEHNYFTNIEPDAAVSSGDVISVKKTPGTKGGKFIIDNLDERSQKGRIWLIGRRYL